MAYRDDLDALAQRASALAQHATAAHKDAEEAARLLAEAQARRRLPVLESLHVAAPCHADWSKMIGDERVRFCGSCEKNVYNLSEMTRAEAESLLLAKEGKLCVRYYQRSDGTILSADCPVGVKRRRRRRRVAAAAFGAMSAVAAAAALLHRGPMVTMGVMAHAPSAPQAAAEEPIAVMGDPAPTVGEVMGGLVPPPPQPRSLAKSRSAGARRW